MKYLRRFLLWPLLFLLLVITGVIGYVAGTESGLQQSLTLAQKYAPGELSWDQASGKYFGPLHIINLQFNQPDGIKLTLDEASFDWNPGALFRRKLKINQLHLSGLEAHLPPPSETEQPKVENTALELPDIQLPLDISLNDIKIEDIRIFPHGEEEPILVERIELVAAGEEAQLRLVDLSIVAPDASATLKGYVKPQGEYPLDLNLLWTFTHPEFGEFSGDGAVEGSLADLKLQHALKGVVNADIKGSVTNALNAPSWDILVTGKSKDLSPFSEALHGAPLDATVVSKGTLDGFSVSADVQTALEQTGPLALNLTGDGDTKNLNIQNLLLALKQVGGTIQLNGSVDIEQQSVDLKGKWKKLAWPLTTNTPDFLSPRGNLAVKGGAEDFVINLSSLLDGNQLLPLEANINASGKGKKIELHSLSLKGEQSDLQLTTQGTLDLDEQEFDLTGDWDSLAWPMQGDAEFSSPKGTFKANGLFTEYAFQADAALAGKAIPDGQWSVNGNGTDKSLSDFKVSGKTLGGQIQTTGSAAWAPAVKWDVKASTQTINPGLQWADFPGSLNVQLVSKGTLKEGEPSLTAEILQLDGTLKDKPVKGRGKVKVLGQDITIDQLNISSGNTELVANGVLAEQWNLDYKFAAPSLDHWAPSLAGSFKAEGQLSGTSQAPKLKSSFSGSGLKSGETSVRDIKGQAEIDISGSNASILVITANKLSAGGQTWESLNLKGSGKPKRHTLNIQLLGETGNIETQLDGGLNADTWTGTLSKLSALKTAIGDWTLKSPANISANSSKASASPICLTSAPTEMCIDGQWDASKGSKGNIELSDLEPKRFRAFMPEDLSLENKINLNASGAVSASGRTTGDAQIALSTGKLILRTTKDPATIDLGESLITAKLQGEKANTDIKLDLGKLGDLTAQVSLNGLSDKGRLSGTVSPNFGDLSILSLIAPQLQEVSGKFTGNLNLGGSVAAPQINGQLDLDDFSAEVPEVAIKVEETELHIRGSGDSPLQIEGSSKSGEGTLAINGSLNPKAQFFDIAIKGEEYVVANSSHLKARISPDIQIAMNQDGMLVKGKLVIPQAFIDANGGSAGIETVSGSSDVVIIDENGQRNGAKASDNLNVNLQIVLGDDIKVEAGDFSGRLKGNLLVEQTPQLAPRGTGTIEVVNGDYVIYGQQLTMQQGRILFSGGPIDNPRLDMDVAREVPAYDVLAGAKVRGTAQSPLLELYSEPAMPDASILSYILLGQPPGTKGGSYTLGKFITPDLYVSYGIGLFNAINTFNMRYKLTEKLSVQAASGMANSADLIYIIER